jgi:endonuclease-3
MPSRFVPPQDELFADFLPAAPDPPPPPEDDNTPALRAKLLLVHERLCAEYGCPVGYFHELDPLSELISALLSHRTRNSESGAAFKALRARFPDWPAMRDAPTADVQAAIVACNWPEQKAPRIQQALRLITQRRGGDLSLDFLEGMSSREARDWLETLPGVGPKTSAAVLSFSRLHKRALPVDSHHHRVAQRLGLIPANLDVGPAHAVLEAQLPDDWDAHKVYDNHEILMFHGQRCCFHRAPECPRCVLLDLCPSGQARMKTKN